MWYWIITGFGFLFSLRTARTGTAEKKTDLFLRSLACDALDLCLSLLLLVTLYDLGQIWGGTLMGPQDMGFLAIWAAAFLIGRYQKKQELFFISLAVIASLIVSATRQWSVQLELILVLVFGIFAFQVAFKGLKHALLFSRVPESMKGWPVLCLLAFCVTVVLGGFISLIF